ncbi:MAG: hypothetical protein M3Y45_07225, partial [Actinomycetota bacterium]|nr:hypothetical protein [Actinomycetota bacterium]
EVAVNWADRAPLVFGGDFNVRPRNSPEVFAELHDHYSFTGPADPGSIDHLLLRGGHIEEPAVTWRPERRDVPDPESELSIRLSDHAPVVARIGY